MSARRIGFIGVSIVAVALSMPGPAVAAIPKAATGVTIRGVVSRDGAPIAGAIVTVRALPTTDVMSRAKVGVPLSMPVVASTVTDAAGAFGVEPSAVPNASLNRDHFVNFVAWVSDGTVAMPWNFTLEMSPTSGGTAAPLTASATAKHRAVDLRIDLGSAAGGADALDPPSAWQGAGKLTKGGLAPATTIAVKPGMSPMGCGVMSKTGNYQYGRTEAFANAWSWTGALITFHESIGTNHQLGVGFKSMLGVWSQNGTVSMNESASGSGDVPGLWDNQVNNKVNYAEYLWACGGSARGWYPDSTYALLYPILGWPHSSHPYWSSCVTYGNGARMTKTQGTNTTYGLGVSLAFINVSAQAGWTSSIDETFNFTATSKLCGNTSSGWVSSPEAEAHQ